MKRNPEILPIRGVGDAILHTKAVEVEDIDEDLLRFIDDLVETMYVRDGVGLAAPQVGMPLRIFAADPGFGQDKGRNPVVMINPAIIESAGSQVYEEGCLSIPGVFEKVKRPDYIRMVGMDPQGNQIEVKLEGYESVVFQHEYDHLDGILFIDRIPRLRLIPWRKKIKEIRNRTNAEGTNILPDEPEDR